MVYVGSDDGNVYALNAATGAELWGFTILGFVLSSPAIANGALNAATGARLWSSG